MAHQREMVSTEQLQARMANALDEARHIQQLIETKDMVDTLNREYPLSERLNDLNREIACLEERIRDIRMKGRSVSKTA